MVNSRVMETMSWDYYSNKTVLVAGGGGFIGGWLVNELAKLNVAELRVVDIKPTKEWFQILPDDLWELMREVGKKRRRQSVGR